MIRKRSRIESKGLKIKQNRYHKIQDLENEVSTTEHLRFGGKSKELIRLPLGLNLEYDTI